MATTTVDSSTWGLYVHQAKDGTLTVVDSAGKAIASPPDVELTANGSLTVVDSSGVAQTGSETDPDGVVSESEEHNTDRNTKDQPTPAGIGLAHPHRSGSCARLEITRSRRVIVVSGSKPFYVALQASGLPGHGSITYTPIAVDETGTPLAVQPLMTLDPTDPTKVIIYDNTGAPITVTDDKGQQTAYHPEIYEPEKYSVFLEPSGLPGHGSITYTPIAVDETGTPLAVQPLMTLDPTDPTKVIIYDNTGAPITVTDDKGQQTAYHPEIYEPEKYSVFLEPSGLPGHGSITYTPIAVDETGTPLAVQPLMTLDPTDPTKVIIYDNTGAPITVTDDKGQQTAYHPEIYEPEKYSVFLEPSGLPGHGSITYTPIAVDETGTPLAVQPLMTLDPTDPTKVIIYDNTGAPITVTDDKGQQTAYHPEIYEPEKYSVFLEPSGLPGHGSITYTPIAVDETGTPLAVQPLMTLDPTDPTKVIIYDNTGAPITVTDDKGQQTAYHPEIYEPEKYSVFLEPSGLPGHGSITYTPIAVDETGTPLAVQPLMTLDPTDPTKVIIYDNTGAPITVTDDKGQQTAYHPEIYEPEPAGYVAPEEEEEETEPEPGIEEDAEPTAEEETETQPTAEEETEAEPEAEEAAPGRASDEELVSEPAVTGVRIEGEESTGEESVVDPGFEEIAPTASPTAEEPQTTEGDEISTIPPLTTPEPTTEPIERTEDLIATSEVPPPIITDRGGEESMVELVTGRGEVEAVGPVGLGAEELVEMVSGPVAEEGEAAAREEDGPSAGGEQDFEIPDLLAPELDRKGDDRPVPGQGDVEFRVEVAPAEEMVDAEPIAEVVEVDSVTGLGSDELRGVLTGSDATIAAEEAGEGIVERVEAEGSRLGEEVPELKWGTEVGAGVGGFTRRRGR